jgi:hypothetical protein
VKCDFVSSLARIVPRFACIIFGGGAMIGFGVLDAIDIIPDPTDAVQKGARERVVRSADRDTLEGALGGLLSMFK